MHQHSRSAVRWNWRYLFGLAPLLLDGIYLELNTELLCQELRACSDRWRPKQDVKRQIDTEGLLDLGKESHCYERVPADFKEVIVESHALDAQQLLPEVG